MGLEMASGTLTIDQPSMEEKKVFGGHTPYMGGSGSELV